MYHIAHIRVNRIRCKSEFYIYLNLCVIRKLEYADRLRYEIQTLIFFKRHPRMRILSKVTRGIFVLKKLQEKWVCVCVFLRKKNMCVYKKKSERHFISANNNFEIYWCALVKIDQHWIDQWLLLIYTNKQLSKPVKLTGK